MSKIKCVLLVDDDRINNFLCSQMIKKAGISNNVQMSADGQQGINYLINAHPETLPDLILLDINMPVMDGFEFLEEFVKLEIDPAKKVRIFMLTTSTNERDISKGKEFPINEYLNKPLKEEKLFELVNKYF